MKVLSKHGPRQALIQVFFAQNSGPSEQSKLLPLEEVLAESNLVSRHFTPLWRLGLIVATPNGSNNGTTHCMNSALVMRQWQE